MATKRKQSGRITLQRLPSVKTIREWFNLDHYSRNPQKDAKKIRELLEGARYGYNVDNDRAIEQINKIVDGHGVEAIRGDTHIDPYFTNMVALYINMGDTYNPTLLYETETGKWRLTTYGDWVAKHNRRYKLNQVMQY